MGKRFDFKSCKGCRFLGSVNGHFPICNYIGYTGRRRGCPIGARCTQKQNGKPGELFENDVAGVNYNA